MLIPKYSKKSVTGETGIFEYHFEVKNISKTFKVAKRKSGLKESIKSFFKRDYNFVSAIDSISSIKSSDRVEYLHTYDRHI